MPTTTYRDKLRYTPGDGNVYGWDGGRWITVYRVEYDRDGTRREVETADVIAAPAVRTGTSLIQAVDQWRGRS